MSDCLCFLLGGFRRALGPDAVGIPGIIFCILHISLHLLKWHHEKQFARGGSEMPSSNAC